MVFTKASLSSLCNTLNLWKKASIRWLNTESSLWSLSLVFVISSALYLIYFVHPVDIFHQQRQKQVDVLRDLSSKSTELEENQTGKGNGEMLFQGNEILEITLNACRNAKKSLSVSLEKAKEIRQMATTLNVKLELCEKQRGQEKQKSEDLTRIFNEEKKMIESNVTLNREFFDFWASTMRNTPYKGVEEYVRYSAVRLRLSPLVNVIKLKTELGPVMNDVLSFNYPISVSRCQESAIGNQSVFLAVISATNNFVKRQMIRQTWLRHFGTAHAELGMKRFAFILGMADDNATQKSVEEESKKFGDIIQIGMSDFYRNLSLKVAALFNWLYRNCDKIDFVFKVDDDVYVNVRNLAHFVHSFHNRSTNSIFGVSAVNLRPARGGKWNITFEEWPWNEYPPYFFGPAVLMHGSAIVPLLASFQTTPIMPFDDIYYSGICPAKVGIHVRFSTDSSSVLAMNLRGTPSPCELRRFISWLTVSGSHMNDSHVATSNFYSNVTQCIFNDNAAANPSEPVQFYFR
ncbi:hypothetical protein OUZ56_011078 [Daphnia magna]|uniref:Hexosyltransferase n=1 Tax=Daphnia magna TaxID=35525 RepID=A0ABQ9YZ70_9CRUS|nr:hypothetical protein OUZ56_011078 [Daphnia magna]